MPPEIQTQVSSENDEKAMRMAEIDRKRLELRKRMEEASKARRSKKSFMTPERKKKLRLLLRKKAAEELKKEQERKAQERRWIIDDRCGEPEDLEWASKDDLIDVCEYYFQRILDCESEKWDLELEIRKRAFEIAELNSKVNDLRGKFQRPILKKVSKYENKFAKLQRKAAEFNFRNQLRMVKRHEFLLKDDDKKSHVEKQSEVEEKKEEIAEEVADKAAEEGKEDVESSPKEGDDEKLPEGHEGEVTVEGSTEGEPCPEGEPRLEGESLPEGESHQEGESHLDGELHQEEHLSLEGEPHIEGDLRLEGELCPEEEPQLEGELHLEGEQHVEGESEVEGELRLGGQSPVEGEVQPPDSPLPREPHTEEDLWDYLKDTVSSVHPATVEEFVQNLIGTLQHVPAEYLKPVIEANIKRATSPSVTDGEHLPNPEGVAVLGEEGEAAATEESALTTGSEDNTPSADGAVETAVSRDGPEAGDDGDAEGYSAVEGALFAGFWVCWLLYTYSMRGP